MGIQKHYKNDTNVIFKNATRFSITKFLYNLKLAIFIDQSPAKVVVSLRVISLNLPDKLELRI